MKLGRIILILLMIVAVAQPSEGFAAKKSNKASITKQSSLKFGKKKHRARKAVARDQYAALVVDAETGQVLYEKNAGAIRYPASLTKMMTLYLTFEALKKGKLKLDQTLPVSAKAAGQPQTNIALDKGDRLPVRIAIESVVVRSANDSALVLAEGLGRTQFNFALMMTKKARELGMRNTVFRNPSGLPDNKQHTTAFDMARLAIALRRDFPEYYHFFSLQSFDYDGVTYPGHNRVMERYPGVDGVKTGYIRASGFNLVTSAQKDGHRIVAVIMGGSTASSRDNQMIALLDRTFERMEAKDDTDDATDAKKNGSLQASNIQSLVR